MALLEMLVYLHFWSMCALGVAITGPEPANHLSCGGQQALHTGVKASQAIGYCAISACAVEGSGPI